MVVAGRVFAKKSLSRNTLSRLPEVKILSRCLLSRSLKCVVALSLSRNEKIVACPAPRNPFPALGLKMITFKIIYLNKYFVHS